MELTKKQETKLRGILKKMGYPHYKRKINAYWNVPLESTEVKRVNCTKGFSAMWEEEIAERRRLLSEDAKKRWESQPQEVKDRWREEGRRNAMKRKDNHPVDPSVPIQ